MNCGVQWEFQVGLLEGISIEDELWCARYIMKVLLAFLFLYIFKVLYLKKY